MSDIIIPAVIDTPEVTQAVADGKADAAAIVAAAHDAAKTQVADAVASAEKLLQLAAGDVSPILSDAEKSVVSIVVEHVPVSERPIVQSFAQAALGKPEDVLNAAADAFVQRGLAFAIGKLKQFASFLG